MIFFNSHNRARSKLSAYIDGELSGGESNEVESHLESCDACSREVKELRSTIDALASLPEQEPRRSFQLTPGMANRPPARPTYAPSSGLANGARMAAAGLAAALVIVFVVDANDGGTGGDDDAGVARNQVELSEDAAGGLEPAGLDTRSDYFDYGGLEGGDRGSDSDDPSDMGLGFGGGVPDSGDGEQLHSNADDADEGLSEGEDSDQVPGVPAGGDVPVNDGTGNQSGGDGDGAEGDSLVDQSGGSGDDSAEGEPAALEGDSDGIGTLEAIEIGLGVALAVTVVAALWLTFGRHNRQRV